MYSAVKRQTDCQIIKRMKNRDSAGGTIKLSLQWCLWSILASSQVCSPTSLPQTTHRVTSARQMKNISRSIYGGTINDVTPFLCKVLVNEIPSQKTWKTNHKRFYCWHATHLGDNSKENDRETHVPIQAGSQQQRQEIATSTSNSFEKWPLLLFNWTHKGLWSLPYLNYGMCMCEMVRGKIKETGIVHREHVSTWDRKKNLFEKDPACAWLPLCDVL